MKLGDVFDVLARLLPIHRLHMPAVRGVAGGDVLGERDVGVVLDRDLVRVVDDDEIAELLMPGQRGGLAGDALLDVPIRGDHIDGVIERRLTRRGLRVEQAPLIPGRVREPDRRGQSLTQRSGRDLHTVGVTELRVTRGLRPPRPQLLQVLQLQPEPTQIQLDVLRQRRMPRREDETITTRPVHIRGVVVHHPLIQQIRRRSETHRRSGVTIADLLDSIRRQHAHGVHRAPIDLFPCQLHHGVSFDRCEVASAHLDTNVINRCCLSRESVSRSHSTSHGGRPPAPFEWGERRGSGAYPRLR